MADFMDMLNVTKPIGEVKTVPKPKPKTKKPAGMSREVYALLRADNEDPAPLITTDFGMSSKLGFPPYGYKKAKANFALRKVRKYSWVAFTNPSRKDGFQLYHWRREVDKNKEYPFVQMNVSVNLPTYTDAEYQELLTSTTWSRNETDYLFKMCRKFDVRFVVIHDRWDEGSYGARTIEDIKDRFYSVCHALETHRGLTADPNQQIHGCVYDAEHERKRKEQLIKLYKRTPKEVEEEQTLAAALRKIEQRKKEREKKTQDLQKLITAADSSANERRAEQQNAARPNASISRSNRKKTLPIKGSRLGELSSGSMNNVNVDSAGIKFPEMKTSGVWLRSARMKLPSTVGTKRVKAIDTMLKELNVDPMPMATEDICLHFNQLRSEMVLLYELKSALNSLEYELQSLNQAIKLQNESLSLQPLGTSMETLMLTDPGDATINSQISPIPTTPDDVRIKKEPGLKRMSEVIDVANATPRKRKAALEQVNMMRTLRKN